MTRFLKYLFRSIIILFVVINIIVAFHAYKFTHFYNKGEIIIKKAEDKTGWDKTMEILTGINAIKKVNTVVPDSSFVIISLKTKDSLNIDAWYLAVDSAVGTICMFHGHGSSKSAIFKEAEEFRKMRYNTLLVDFRAHGSSEGNTCTIGYGESEEVKLAYDFIKSRGENNIVLWGISMGASTITKAVKDYDLQPKKIILEMPFGTIKDAVIGRVKMMGVPTEPIASLLTFWGGAQHGFWAFGMKPQEYAKSINCPVLLQWGKNDTRVSQAEEEMLFSNIPHQNKKFVVYGNSAHESLYKKESEKWKTEVNAFLK